MGEVIFYNFGISREHNSRLNTFVENHWEQLSSFSQEDLEEFVDSVLDHNVYIQADEIIQDLTDYFYRCFPEYTT